MNGSATAPCTPVIPARIMWATGNCVCRCGVASKFSGTAPKLCRWSQIAPGRYSFVATPAGVSAE
ncbi:MAG: hypothetical protein HMLKMBBP_00336 [Planctomycetes bacterium]|nr:hypothetical protein [Planctomycetota bacterium]